MTQSHEEIYLSHTNNTIEKKINLQIKCDPET